MKLYLFYFIKQNPTIYNKQVTFKINLVKKYKIPFQSIEANSWLSRMETIFLTLLL